MRRYLPFLAGLLAACGSGAAPTTPGPGPDVEPDPPAPARVEPCDEELSRFLDEVHSPILVTQCAPCHNAEGPAAQSRLLLEVAKDLEGARANWHAAGALGVSRIDEGSELLLRASDRHPRGHPGGSVVPFGSEDYLALEAFVGWYADEACDAPPEVPEVTCETPGFGPRLLRRLSHAEYDASLEDITGYTSTRALSLAVDPRVGGFDNHAGSLVVGSLLADQLRRNAEAVADELVAEIDRHLPCRPTPATEADCRDLFIRRFVGRVYRRPVTDTELARYVELFDATSEGAFEEGVRWVVTAALQSPNFLYRSELGHDAGDGTHRLDDYEIASALSFFLTGGPPDAQLLSTAAAGQLGSASVRQQQARRLLLSPAGQRHVAHFFEAWLSLDRVETIAKDPQTYPGMTPRIRAAMAGETQRFLRWVLLRDEGTLPQLFTAPYTFVNPDLESFYGDRAFGTPDEEGYRQLETPGKRFGLLTQGNLLSVHAKPNDASPVHRGKMVRERLLCQELEPPPPGLVVEPPPVDPNATTRERYAAHSEVEPCRSCHRLIDPIGFGFGAYDGVGRHRTEEAGRPIEAYGEIVDTEHTDGEFEDLAGLAAMLAASPDVHACFADRWQRWAFGLGPEEGLDCVLEPAYEAFEASGLKVEALLIALAGSRHLEVRTSSTAP